nr:chaperone protein DnaJ C76, chloroplastic [Ipomoea batatas]
MFPKPEFIFKRVVERSDLAALEFLMSKKPRGNVRIGAGNTVGARTSSIFDDLEKFQARFHDANTNKSSKAHSNVSDEERDAQNSAIQAIRAMSNWLYWQSPRSGITQLQQSLVLIGEKPNEPNIEKLKAAAAARKQGKLTISATHIYSDEYWIPSNLVLPEPTKMNTPGNKTSPQVSRSKKHKETSERDSLVKKHDGSRPWSVAIPVVTGTIGAITVWLQIPGDGKVLPGGLNEHLGGSLALDIINSSGLQVILAGVTWYLIGLYITELVEALLSVTKGHSK